MEGGAVGAGDALATIETDKSSMTWEVRRQGGQGGHLAKYLADPLVVVVVPASTRWPHVCACEHARGDMFVMHVAALRSCIDSASACAPERCLRRSA